MIGQKGMILYFITFCFAREDDTQFIDKIVAVHKGGVPAIAMHCAMHTYHPYLKGKNLKIRVGIKCSGWFLPGTALMFPYDVTIAKEQTGHPVVKGLPKKWRTPKGELYMVPMVMEGTTVLAYGDNGAEHKPPNRRLWPGSKKKMDSSFMRPLWGIIMRLYPPKSSWTWWPMELAGLLRSSV